MHVKVSTLLNVTRRRATELSASLGLFLAVPALLLAPGCGNAQYTKANSTDRSISIPSHRDWTNRGVAIVPASSGWDRRLPAGAPATIVKLGSTYYLYYVGADGDRPSDGGPAHRGLGLATSTDGTTWIKHPSNPILPWSLLNTYGDDEEGAWRAAAMLDDDGTVMLYLTQLRGAGGSVGGHIQLFTSSDGVNFIDHGEVIHANDSDYPGSDEYGVLGAAKSAAGLYHLHFTAKGSLSWDVVEAHAATRDGFTSGDVLLGLSEHIRYGSNPIRISDTDWIVPIGTYGGEIRLYRTNNLAAIGTLVETYGDLPNSPQSRRGNLALYLDRDVGTWFLLIAETDSSQSADRWHRVRVLTAPMALAGGP